MDRRFVKWKIKLMVLWAAIAVAGVLYADPAQGVANILEFGAVADNRTDISAAFQAAIDEAASRPEGGEVFIPSGLYVLNSTVRLKPKVNIVASSAAQIRAGVPLIAMIDSDVGNSKTRLRHQFIRGGQWHGKGIADRIFLLRDFEALSIKGASLLDCQKSYIEVDGAGATASCYELMVSDVVISRTKDAGPRPDGCVGIRAGFNKAGLSDSHFSDLVISGVERGLSGSFYVSKFCGVHVWGYGPTQGRVDAGFYMNGQNNQFVLCQVDNPRKYGWYIAEDGTQIGHSCITYGTGGNWLAGDEAVCVYVAEAADGFYNVGVDNNRWNVQKAEAPILAEFAGDLRGMRAHGNSIRSGNILKPYGDTGPGELEASVNLLFKQMETLVRNNVASVEKTPEGNLSVRFTRALGNNRYGVNVDLVAEDASEEVAGWVLTQKTVDGFVLRLMPASARDAVQVVNIQCIGAK